ncbi:uncharacterized protein LOC135379050 [Ornithodoros turicata]|uniref:uncharacterized protein LOC135379050 n=1 Tax=Ornithodoros turicata TaxID=34597 RepID=UPI00313967AB
MTAMSGSTAALQTQSAQVSTASDLGMASAQTSEAVIGPDVAPARAERPDEVNLVDESTSSEIAKRDECDTKHLDQCYQHLIPAYKDDLNRRLCYTTTDAQKAPTFSRVVGFNVDNFCKAAATGRTESGQACFDDDHVLCFFKQCGKQYREIKALARRNWNIPDSHYDETAACDKYP